MCAPGEQLIISSESVFWPSSNTPRFEVILDLKLTYNQHAVNALQPEHAKETGQFSSSASTDTGCSNVQQKRSCGLSVNMLPGITKGRTRVGIPGPPSNALRRTLPEFSDFVKGVGDSYQSTAQGPVIGCLLGQMCIQIVVVIGQSYITTHCPRFCSPQLPTKAHSSSPH